MNIEEARTKLDDIYKSTGIEHDLMKPDKVLIAELCDREIATTLTGRSKTNELEIG